MAQSECLDGFLSNITKSRREKARSLFSQQSQDRGQFIFFEGDPAGTFYIVEQGVVEANIVHGDGKVYIFQFVFPGDFFGEEVLYGQERYPFSAVVRKDVAFWKIPKGDLLPIVNSDSGFKDFLFNRLGLKLEAAYGKQRCVAGERVEKRVACVLLRSLDLPGTHEDCFNRFDTPLTNRDISGLIGSTEETVSRIMSRLKKEGIVAVKDKQLVIQDSDKLRDYFESL